jgi:hypothetical protein
METVPVEFTAPVTPAAKPAGVTEKLTMTLTAAKEDMKKVTLRIAWGARGINSPCSGDAGKLNP